MGTIDCAYEQTYSETAALAWGVDKGEPDQREKGGLDVTQRQREYVKCAEAPVL